MFRKETIAPPKGGVNSTGEFTRNVPLSDWKSDSVKSDFNQETIKAGVDPTGDI